MPPVEAMRASAAEGSASLRNRTIAGVVFGVIAVVAIAHLIATLAAA